MPPAAADLSESSKSSEASAARGVLTVEPRLGLCNRLRVMDSAIAFARATGRGCRVVWFRDEDLNCAFARLFERPEGVAEIREAHAPRWLRGAVQRFIRFTARRRGDHYDQSRVVQEVAARGVRAFEGAPANLYLRTWERFFPVERPYAVFRPAPALRAIIARRGPELRDAVGVHIRRTDHDAARAASTTEHFIAAMRGAGSSRSFFLATDDADEERRICETFPGRVVVHPKRSRDRNTPEAIEDAVVDLYSLGACRRVLGSRGSSFSMAAFQLASEGGEFVG